MRPGSEFGNYSSVLAMKFYLGRNDIRKNPSLRNDRNAGLVARSFKSQKRHLFHHEEAKFKTSHSFCLNDSGLKLNRCSSAGFVTLRKSDDIYWAVATFSPFATRFSGKGARSV